MISISVTSYVMLVISGNTEHKLKELLELDSDNAY